MATPTLRRATILALWRQGIESGEVSPEFAKLTGADRDAAATAFYDTHVEMEKARRANAPLHMQCGYKTREEFEAATDVKNLEPEVLARVPRPLEDVSDEDLPRVHVHQYNEAVRMGQHIWGGEAEYRSKHRLFSLEHDAFNSAARMLGKLRHGPVKSWMWQRAGVEYVRRKLSSDTPTFNEVYAVYSALGAQLNLEVRSRDHYLRTPGQIAAARESERACDEMMQASSEKFGLAMFAAPPPIKLTADELDPTSFTHMERWEADRQQRGLLRVQKHAARNRAVKEGEPIYISPVPCRNCGGTKFYTSAATCQHCVSQRALMRYKPRRAA